ncbi:hypothetical protein AU510_07640 [Lonsdalea britannica]|nr:hypothetical protein AU510_07640 [Lonsdalea britannica]
MKGRAGLNVVAIAARAERVPPTIYRRWKGPPYLLVDMAIKQMQPEQPPLETGSFSGDNLSKQNNPPLSLRYLTASISLAIHHQIRKFAPLWNDS